MNEIRPIKMKFIQNNTVIGRMINGPMKGENMADYIPAPTIREILREKFIEPMNVSAYRLAKEIHVPVSRVQASLFSPILPLLNHVGRKCGYAAYDFRAPDSRFPFDRNGVFGALEYSFKPFKSNQTAPIDLNDLKMYNGDERNGRRCQS